MCPSTLIHLLLSETGLILTQLVSDFWHKAYAYQLLTLSDCHLTEQILSISLIEKDENIKPGKQPEDILI